MSKIGKLAVGRLLIHINCDSQGPNLEFCHCTHNNCTYKQVRNNLFFKFWKDVLVYGKKDFPIDSNGEVFSGNKQVL